MSEEIAYSVSVDTGGGEQSLTQLRAEFKQLNTQLEGTKKGTKEFNDALQALATNRGKIIELKEQINALNPEARAKAIASISGSLAGGFQAATGAAALFGSKAEDVQKVLVRVQAATALAQGIQQVTQLGNAFTALKLILISNPLFVLATVMIAIGAAVYELTSSINEESEQMKAATKVTDDYATANEKASRTLKDLKIDLMVEQGLMESSTAAIVKAGLDKNDQLAEAEKKYHEDEKNIRDKNSKEYIEDEKERNKALTNLSEEYFLNTDKIRQIAQEKTQIENEKQKNKELDDLGKRWEKKEALDEEHRKKAEAKAVEDLKKYEEYQKSIIDLVYKVAAQREKNADEVAKQESDLIDEGGKELVAHYQLQKQLDDDTLKRQQKNKEDRKQLIQDIIQLEGQAASSIGALTTTLYNNKLLAAKGNAAEELKIKREQFRVEKALNAGQTAMNTATAIMKILSQGGLYATPIAIATGVLGAIQEAAILAQQFDSGGGSGATTSIPSPGGGSASAPNIEPPQQQATQQTNVNTNSQGNFTSFGTVKAYVVESDITSSQNQVQRIEDKSKF